MKNKKYKLSEWVIFGCTFILATFAVLVGLGLIQIGEAGIKFLF